MDKMDLVRQIEQTEGRPKQRHFGRVDDVFDAWCRFDLVAMALSSWRDGRREALSAHRTSSSRQSGDSTLTRRTLTLPPAFVGSQSLFSLSLVRDTLGFSDWSVLRTIFSPLPSIICEFNSLKPWDCCSTDVLTFSSAIAPVFTDGLYNSQCYHFV